MTKARSEARVKTEELDRSFNEGDVKHCAFYLDMEGNKRAAPARPGERGGLG